MIDSLKFSIMFVALLTVVIELDGFNSKRNRHRHKKLHRAKSEMNHPLYKLIPKGCYGHKQLREIFTHHASTIAFKPTIPKWCTEDQFLVPHHLKAKKFQTSIPPYHVHAEELHESRNVFKVVLRSQVNNASIHDAIMVVRPVDKGGLSSHNNRGRFINSPGVQLICCSLTDEDVARFQSKNVYTEEVVFLWVPYEEVTEDFEGDFIFIATVANSLNEYWINVTSTTMSAASSDSHLFDDINV